jgi:hypothetical protein
MLIVQSGAPKPIPVPLGGGAIWKVRPATSFEVTLATAQAQRVAAGLAEGEDAAERAAELLGEEFRGGAFTDKDWVNALVERLVLSELALVCSTDWTGVAMFEGEGESQTVRELDLDRASIAMVLRDPRISHLVSRAVNSAVHIERSDEKKLSASPDGGAKTDEVTAPIVAPPAPAVPAA